jgi:hypothetical protein
MSHYVMSDAIGQGEVTLALDLRVDTFAFDDLVTGRWLSYYETAQGLHLSAESSQGTVSFVFTGLGERDLLSPAFSWSQPVAPVGNGPANGFSHEVQSLAPVSWTHYLGSRAQQAAAVGDVGADVASSAGGLSWDGRWTVFSSPSGRLVDGDTNAHADVFMHDRRTGRTERLSISASGVQADADADGAAVSALANAVAFQSVASNLIDGTTHAGQQVYLKQLEGGEVTLVSAAADGSQGDGTSRDAALSGDARVVAFTSEATNLLAGDSNGHADVFVRRQDDGILLNLSASGDGESGHAQVSYDGRWVVFESAATNLVAGDTNGQHDVFLRDLDSGSLVRVSQTSGGGDALGASRDASVSADGRYVVFISDAANLVAGDSNGLAAHLGGRRWRPGRRRQHVAAVGLGRWPLRAVHQRRRQPGARGHRRRHQRLHQGRGEWPHRARGCRRCRRPCAVGRWLAGAVPECGQRAHRLDRQSDRCAPPGRQPVRRPLLRRLPAGRGAQRQSEGLPR